jgi:hypothetical protein
LNYDNVFFAGIWLPRQPANLVSFTTFTTERRKSKRGMERKRNVPPTYSYVPMSAVELEFSHASEAGNNRLWIDRSISRIDHIQYVGSIVLTLSTLIRKLNVHQKYRFLVAKNPCMINYICRLIGKIIKRYSR